MSLALDSKVKSLASKPSFLQVLKNALSSARTTLLFEFLKMGLTNFFSTSWSTPETSQKFMKTFFFGERPKFCGKFAKIFFFWKTPEILLKICNFYEQRHFFCLEITCKIVSLVIGLGLLNSCPRIVGPWRRFFFFCVLGLEPCVLDSTSGIHIQFIICRLFKKNY